MLSRNKTEMIIKVCREEELAGRVCDGIRRVT